MRGGVLRRHPWLTAVVGVILGSALLGVLGPAVQTYPETLMLTTRSFWGELVKWINVNYFDQLEAMKDVVLINVLLPVKHFMLAALGLGAGAGRLWRVGNSGAGSSRRCALPWVCSSL